MSRAADGDRGMNGPVVTFERLTPEQHAWAGGKGATLARLYQAGYPVPDGFVILPVAFDADELTPLARVHVQAGLARLRRGRPNAAFAVRSSATSEDSALASFAGEFETVLDAQTEEGVYAAIAAVRRSRHSERVQAYSEAKGVSQLPDLAVVVQRLVRADLAGVLFTADPGSGSRMRMVGNYVHGLGDRLVSGEANPDTFTLEQPSGRYDGPPELARFARSLHKLGKRLEKDLDCPQDVEWAIAGGRLFLLQSRPITTLQGRNPATGEWNDSLTGDYLWSSVNVSEAVPDVMTPSTWSLWQIYHFEATPIRIPGKHPFCGNIGGRPYLNLSLLVSLYRAIGRDIRRELPGDMVGTAPRDLDIPIIPFSALSVLRTALPGLLKARWHVSRDPQRLERFVASTPGWCHRMRQRIRDARTEAELASLWRDELKPYFMESCWLVRGATMRFSEPATKLRLALAELVGEADANALLSNLAGESAEMASLGPLVGLAQVERGEMSGEAYMERYGHRGPHEMELFASGPDEDPAWLDHRLAEVARQPVSVDELLARQHAEAAAAWQRLRDRYPRKAPSIRRRLDRTAAAARAREAVRSEMTRITRVVRQFVLRAGALAGLGDGAFFLSLDELTGVLSGDDTPVAFIPARRATYGRYSALPPYPAVINGRFDPFQWAAEPPSARGSDYFDSHGLVVAPGPGTITGHAGAAGCVDGLVRRLDSIEEADQLQPGEILVTTTTNVGWTPLFPRAAAIVTDVGAPLSHAAIVARELGIPAVVGCGDAMMRLQTGDLVHVDGGRGIVEMREPATRLALRPPGDPASAGPDRDQVEGALRRRQQVTPVGR